MSTLYSSDSEGIMCGRQSSQSLSVSCLTSAHKLRAKTGAMDASGEAALGGQRDRQARRLHALV